MIPKVIHYCWFGGKPLPKLARKCIASWRKYLPDFELKLWNEDNFDLNIAPYVAEAYQAKKYAFVSDYARFWILYNYGGYYFDTDVEIIAPFDEIISRGAFMAAENVSSDVNGLQVAPGLGLACEKGHEVYKEVLDYYNGIHYTLDMKNLETVVTHTTKVLRRLGLRDVDEMQQVRGITIYPKAYFNPTTAVGHALELQPESVSIHHYASSWMPWYVHLKKKVRSVIGPKATIAIINFKRKVKRLLMFGKSKPE